jgi:hypothetical protein
MRRTERVANNRNPRRYAWCKRAEYRDTTPRFAGVLRVGGAGLEPATSCL